MKYPLAGGRRAGQATRTQLPSSALVKPSRHAHCAAEWLPGGEVRSGPGHGKQLRVSPGSWLGLYVPRGHSAITEVRPPEAGHWTLTVAVSAEAAAVVSWGADAGVEAVVSAAGAGGGGVAAGARPLAHGRALLRPLGQVHRPAQVLVQGAASQSLELLEGVYDEGVFLPGLRGHVVQLPHVPVPDAEGVELHAELLQLLRRGPGVSPVAVTIRDQEHLLQLQ